MNNIVNHNGVFVIDSSYEGFSGGVAYAVDSVMDTLLRPINREIGIIAYNASYRMTEAAMDAVEAKESTPPKEHGVWIAKASIGFKAHVTEATYEAVASKVGEGFKYWRAGMKNWEAIPSNVPAGAESHSSTMFLKQLELFLIDWEITNSKTTEDHKKAVEAIDKKIADRRKEQEKANTSVPAKDPAKDPVQDQDPATGNKN